MSQLQVFCVYVYVHVLHVSTAKQYMEEVRGKKQKQHRRQTESASEEDPFDDIESYANVEHSSPIAILRSKQKEHPRFRSQTVTSTTGSPGSTSLKRGKSENGKRHSSTFYLPSDVTTPFTYPMKDIEALNVTNRSQAELLDLLNGVRHGYMFTVLQVSTYTNVYIFVYRAFNDSTMLVTPKANRTQLTQTSRSLNPCLIW